MRQIFYVSKQLGNEPNIVFRICNLIAALTSKRKIRKMRLNPKASVKKSGTSCWFIPNSSDNI